MGILDDEAVREHMRRAWLESVTGANAHEEGGFVLRASDGRLRVERWPQGSQNQIEVPEYAGGFRSGMPIIATFHTHPNPPPMYQQEPSLTDLRAVRDDADLHHPDYEGEYVISQDIIYRIRLDGRVENVGSTRLILRTD